MQPNEDPGLRSYLQEQYGDSMMPPTEWVSPLDPSYTGPIHAETLGDALWSVPADLTETLPTFIDAWAEALMDMVSTFVKPLLPLIGGLPLAILGALGISFVRQRVKSAPTAVMYRMPAIELSSFLEYVAASGGPKITYRNGEKGLFAVSRRDMATMDRYAAEYGKARGVTISRSRDR